MASMMKEGWMEIPGSGEVHLAHGVPDRVWFHGMTPPPSAEMAEAINALCGLHVRIGEWCGSESAGDMEAALTVIRDEMGEVLRRLAEASAETFRDRYQKAVDASDTDWDDEAYAMDFDTALHLCGLNQGEAPREAFRESYLRAMHEAAARLARH